MTSSPENIVTDSGEEMLEESDDSSAQEVTPQILNRPDLLAALQGRDHLEMMRNLPQVVKRRIKALKKLQLESTNIEAQFFEEVHMLECKYHELYSPLYNKRKQIITGKYEPNDEECDFQSEDEVESDEPNKETKQVGNQIVADGKEDGVPDFWLTIFKNVATLSDMVQPYDEPILKHLSDVKIIFLPSTPTGFVLEFYFTQNEYFSNSVLSKEYEIKCKPDESDPFSYDGPEIYKCKGCTIDWFKGKNVTVKTIRKKQKHKSRGSVRTVTKTVQSDSFFNFFNPPQITEEHGTDLDEDTQATLTTDFEVGHFIKERIVPRAVLYFTGEALDDEDDFEDEEDDEDGDEYEDEDETDKKITEVDSKSGTPTTEKNVNSEEKNS